jgi:putative two-component system response regulator
MTLPDNKLVLEIESLKETFSNITDKLVKDIKRQDKILARTDRDQMRELKNLSLD